MGSPYPDDAPDSYTVAEDTGPAPKNGTPRKGTRTRRRRASPEIDDNGPLLDSQHYTPRTSQSSGQNRVAEEFAVSFKGKLIHVDRIGWHEWVGSHWKLVPDKRAMAGAQRLLQVLLQHAITRPPAERDQWLMDIRKCESAQGLAGVCRIASGMPGISVEPDDVDNQPDLLAFTNGTYDLRTDQFRDADPADYITKVMGCAYDPDATCPWYDKLIRDSQPDPELQAYIHRQIGSACEGRTREHMLPVYCGTGGNGKGATANDAWMPLFGDYGLAMPVEILLAQSGRDFMTERLSMKGARYVLTSEPRAGAKFNAALLKLLAGGDKMSARPLYSNRMLQWCPTHQAFMLCNTRPTPPADDHGTWRRLKPVDWLNEVPEQEMNAKLPQYLAAELPGIANRVLAGWRDFRDNGLQVPESCIQAAKAWRAEVDILGQFLEECCVLDPAAFIKSSKLFTKWASFAHEINEEPGNNKMFTSAMKAKKFMTKRSNGVHFIGVRLKEGHEL